ncbi:unnamed protein product [Spirodela intermedia]|uniref:Uncharacterized protein n=1 Tax=Spirodela intermedia TaxID=51605 RepID=A0A7I8J634_SPIIN|nr:unnamed protein product [Spirodela intermedia]CAA6664902.1 unnamed protein product [Spirodela intermedia]
MRRKWRSPSSVSPAWLHAARTLTMTTPSGRTPAASILSKSSAAFLPSPWMPYPEMMAVQETTVLWGISSNSFWAREDCRTERSCLSVH